MDRGDLLWIGYVYYTEDALLKATNYMKCTLRPVSIGEAAQIILTARLCTNLIFLICISLQLSHTLDIELILDIMRA